MDLSKTNEEILVEEILELKRLLSEKEKKLNAIRNVNNVKQPYGLCNEEIVTYSRQIILPEIGILGQFKLKNSSVLIVGVGGLGCPSSLYLSRCGIGRIGLVDYDNVELNNLHRQSLFSYNHVGMPKVEAAKDVLCQMNTNLIITPYKLQIDSTNALEIIKKYHIIIDATDNVATRYLLNDACVIAGKPLVSGSALRFEGQLTVYNYENSPCYRCIFPSPPPPETVTNCGDVGVFGPVVGAIGVLQALEAIKIILKFPKTLSGEMLIFDGLEGRFRNIKLRSKNKNCVICSSNPALQKLIDYEQFCGAKANDKDTSLKILTNNERINVENYRKVTQIQPSTHILIDVRSREEFQICKLDNSVNIPFSDIQKNEVLECLNKSISDTQTTDIFVICRRGNDSQRAVQILKKSLTNKNLKIKDIIGGIHAWAKQIDNSLPIY